MALTYTDKDMYAYILETLRLLFEEGNLSITRYHESVNARGLALSFYTIRKLIKGSKQETLRGATIGRFCRMIETTTKTKFTKKTCDKIWKHKDIIRKAILRGECFNCANYWNKQCTSPIVDTPGFIGLCKSTDYIVPKRVLIFLRRYSILVNKVLKKI